MIGVSLAVDEATGSLLVPLVRRSWERGIRPEGAAMAASSVTVVTNSLRLRRFGR